MKTPEKVNSVLFITLSNLGDIILTTPVLQKLSKAFPRSAIDVITGHAGREILEKHPSVREVISYDRPRSIRKRIEFLIALRRKKYDVVVDLKNSLLAFFTGAFFRAAPLFFKRDLSPVRSGTLHKRDEHLLKLRRLGIDISNPEFFLPISDSDRRAVDGMTGGNSGARTVLLNPGSKSHLKRWGAIKYAELSDRLTRELKSSVFVAGNGDDSDAVNRFLSFVKCPARDISGKTSIGALAEFMRRSDLVVTNDSAPLHMASAVGAPTVAIFGPSDDGKYGPLSEKSAVIKPAADCRPCGRALCEVGPDEGCINEVTVDEVFEAARKILEEGCS